MPNTPDFMQSFQRHPEMNANILAHVSPAPAPHTDGEGVPPDLPPAWTMDAGEPFPWGRSFF